MLIANINTVYRFILGGIFNFSLDSSLTGVVDGEKVTANFTRGPGTATVRDFEGNDIVVLDSESRFFGARRVHNLAVDSDNGNLRNLRTALGASQTGNDEITLTLADGGFLYYNSLPVKVGNRIVVSVSVTGGTAGVVAFRINDDAGASAFTQIDTSVPGNTSLTLVATTDGFIGFGIDNRVIFGSDPGATGTVLVDKFQVELHLNNAVTTPSEHVSIGVLPAPFHGANVDGVKYFSTDLVGAAAQTKGIAIESEASNIIIYSEDNTQNPPGGSTAVVGINFIDCTAINQFGYVNTAIMPAGTYTASVYLQSISGSATVGFRFTHAADGGQSVNKVVTLSTTGVVRETLTLTTTTAGGLSIGIDQRGFVVPGANGQIARVRFTKLQIETNGHASTYIPTSGLSLTRAAERLSVARPTILNLPLVNDFNFSLQHELVSDNAANSEQKTILFAANIGFSNRFSLFSTVGGNYIAQKVVASAQTNVSVTDDETQKIRLMSGFLSSTNGVEFSLNALTASNANNNDIIGMDTGDDLIHIGSDQNGLGICNATIKTLTLTKR